MKPLILLLSTFALSLAAGDIVGYKEFKLGGKLSKPTREAPHCPHYWKTARGNPRLIVEADKDKKIQRIIVTHSYKQDYEYKTARAAYAATVRDAIKEHGKGEGSETSAGWDDRPQYVIATGKTVMTITIQGSYVHVTYTFRLTLDKK